MKVYNLYIKDSGNIGDDVCAPLLYFDLGIEQILYDNRKWRDIIEDVKDNLVILGGGGLFHIPNKDYNNGRFANIEEQLEKLPNLILWGTGHNIHGETKITYPSYMNKFLLKGIRDRHTSYRWVPCASCMSPLFDKQYKATNKKVNYCHIFTNLTQHNNELAGLPIKFCCDTSFEEAVEFLASAETIYTNSYHGAYWGLLLNKKVIVFEPYSSKFSGLPNFVEFNYLELCRRTNVLFYNDVKTIVERMKNGI